MWRTAGCCTCSPDTMPRATDCLQAGHRPRQPDRYLASASEDQIPASLGSQHRRHHLYLSGPHRFRAVRGVQSRRPPDGKLRTRRNGALVGRVTDVRLRQHRCPGYHCRAVLDGHAGWVTHVAFSLDGATLVSASEDGTVRLWHIAGDDASPWRGSIAGGDPRSAPGWCPDAGNQPGRPYAGHRRQMTTRSGCGICTRRERSIASRPYQLGQVSCLQSRRPAWSAVVGITACVSGMHAAGGLLTLQGYSPLVFGLSSHSVPMAAGLPAPVPIKPCAVGCCLPFTGATSTGPVCHVYHGHGDWVWRGLQSEAGR